MVDAERHQFGLRPGIIDLSNDNFRATNLEVSLAYQCHRENEQELTADTSFSRQMHAIVAQEVKPDIFIAMYRSAVPILGAVVGYYEELGQPAPHLDTLDIGGRNYRRHATEVVGDIRHNERRRLASIVRDAHVVLIDEFFDTGYTVCTAAELLRSIGASSIHAFSGKWYDKVDDTDGRSKYTSIRTLRKAWKPFMEKIGHHSAQVEPSSDHRTSRDILESVDDNQLAVLKSNIYSERIYVS